MILTQQLLYEIDMKLNKKASTEHQSIPLEDKIIALNDAQIKLIKKKLDINNIYQVGMDGSKKRYQDLEDLVVPFEERSVTLKDGEYPVFEFNLNNTLKKFMFPLDAYVTATKGSCKKRKLDIPRIAKHGDISTWMNNPHYKPSFEHQETFATISSNKYQIYTDKTFVVNKLYISYLRYPVKIDFEGYEDFDGTLSTTVNCELPDYLKDELLDLATLELGLQTENTPVIQYSDIRNKINE